MNSYVNQSLLPPFNLLAAQLRKSFPTNYPWGWTSIQRNGFQRILSMWMFSGTNPLNRHVMSLSTRQYFIINPHTNVRCIQIRNMGSLFQGFPT